MGSASGTPVGEPGSHVRIVAALSTTSGSGATSTLVSLAWVLAGAGRRVLLLDGGSDVPIAGEYLRPLYLEDVPLPPELEPVLRGRARGELTAARFTWPGADGHIDVHTLTGPDEHGSTQVFQVGSSAAAALRMDLLMSGYDDVLIDTPAGLDSVRFVAAACDVALVCFLPRPRAVQDGAALTARLLGHAPTGIEVVAVATKFDDAYLSRAERIRTTISGSFAGLLLSRPQDAVIEIPYRPYETFDPIITVLAEEQTPDSGLRAGYARLAEATTGGAVTTVATVSPAFHSRYLRAFDLEPSEAVEDRIIICYAPHDRPWADWTAERLRTAGVRTGQLGDGAAWLVPENPPGLVVISSRHLAATPHQEALDKFFDRAGEAGISLDVLRVIVDGTDILPHRAGESIVAAPGTGEQLAAKITNFFGLVDRADNGSDTTYRLPGERPPVFSLPGRHPDFVGRDSELELLRDRLITGADASTLVTLSGLPGVGKSELALEYGHRFGHTYDIVWWVPGEDQQSVVDGLARLASRLSGQDADGATSPGELNELIAAEPLYRRFLLIFDNVEDRSDLQPVLPLLTSGEVIITSSVPATEGGIELTELIAADSVALLTRRVRGLGNEDAERVADAVHHLPVALGLAGALLKEKAAMVRGVGGTVFDAAAWAAGDLLDALAGRTPDPDGCGELDASPMCPPAVSRILEAVTEAMRTSRNGRLAVLLAELCAYLSAEGVGLELVRSTAMRDRLVALDAANAAALSMDAAEIDRVLWLGVRYGLFRVYWGTARILRMHRVIQSALRATMTEQNQEARRAEALRVLAGFAPTEIDDEKPDYEQRFAELQRHMGPSGAAESDDDDVRRWLVNQVRYLYSRGTPNAHRAALAPTQKLLDAWLTRHGGDDPLRLRLAGQLANLHRTLGNPAQALRLDDSALAVQRSTLSRNDPQALVTARGRGGDLRGLGLFDEALAEDQATWDTFLDELGPDHPQTQMAANNLAASLFLSGDTRRALEVAEENYQQRFHLLGQDNQRTWSSLVKVGTYRRELGEYDASLTALRFAAQQVRVERRGSLELTIQHQLAVTLRAQGDVASARDRLTRVYREMRVLMGPAHPRTLACALSLAAAHRSSRAGATTAVELTQLALQGFERNTAGVQAHPFVALCQLGLGLALAATGTSGIDEVRRAWESLRYRLGDVHPWTLAATINHASLMARFDDSWRARTLAGDAYRDCVEFLGGQHPYTLIAGHNADIGDQSAKTWKEVDVDIPDT